MYKHKINPLFLVIGFVGSVVILGGVRRFVYAQQIQTLSSSSTESYTIQIPSETNIDKDGKATFSVSGSANAQTKLDVSVSSQNDYKLKCGSKSLDYTLDMKSFSVDDIYSSKSKDFNQSFNIQTKKMPDTSGEYKDTLTFNITNHKYMFQLDLNSICDGVTHFSTHGFGTCDVYINGVKVRDDISDYCENYNYGDTYEIKDIKGTDGHHYSGVEIGTIGNDIKGTFGCTPKIEPRYEDPYSLVTPVYVKFDTNKLTINYHGDGAQTWNDFQEISHDVSDKDIAYSETKSYGAIFDATNGLVNVNRLYKKGYTPEENTWAVGNGSSQKVLDNVGLAKTEDVAEYCGVLDEFKKNDVTVDLYPIWNSNLNTITFDANGGKLNSDSTKQVYTGQKLGSFDVAKTFSNTDNSTCEDLGYYYYSFGNKITVAAKVKFNSFDQAVSNAQEYFCNYEGAGFGLGIANYDTSNHRKALCPYFSVLASGASDYQIVEANKQLEIGKTYSIVGVYDSDAKRLDIYINGEKQIDLYYKSTDLIGSVVPSPCGVTVGGNPTRYGNPYDCKMDGQISKVGLWKEALSDSQIKQMYDDDSLIDGSFIHRDYSEPEKDNYLFDGWYTSPTGGTKYTSDTVITGAVTLYAHYKPVSYFVEYDSNGGNGEKIYETHSWNDGSKLAKNTFTKDGYKFVGWQATRLYRGKTEYLYINKNGKDGWFEKGKQSSDWTLYTLPDEASAQYLCGYNGLTITMHAQWEKDS